MGGSRRSRAAWLVALAWGTCPLGLGAQSEVQQLRERVTTLEAMVQELRSNSSAGEGEKARLGARVAELEARLEVADDTAAHTDLEELTESVIQDSEARVLGQPWFKNIDMWGFGAMTFVATGKAGKQPHGSFQVKETSLFIEAEAWEDISVFFELHINRLGKDDSTPVRTGEVYAHFRSIFGLDGPSVGVKVGRFDIPFGEEYLYQDSPDNPLITNSAPYPYGWDEGVLVYGEVGGVGWIAAITDGTDERSIDDDVDKSLNAKLYGRPTDWLYLSGSFMRQARAGKSAFEFGGSHFQPVGASHSSTVGSSPSSKVDAILYEIDVRLSCDELGWIALSFGQAFADDKADSFDRDFLWFAAEVVVNLSTDVYAVARFSQIDTCDKDEGYHFDGKVLAGGNGAFGYDARRLQRLSVGLGWRLNQNVLFKIEAGRDWFTLIQQSSLRTRNAHRWFAGVETVLSF